jgi:hypothetical protein
MQLIAVVKRDCETCALVAPVLAALSQLSTLTVYSQDDPTFPEETGGAADDTNLEHSYRLGVTTVPTLIRYENNQEISRTDGWDRTEWQRVTDIDFLGNDLVAFRPGCGSLTQYPGMPEKLALRFGDITFKARAIELAPDDDPIEATYDRGWSDGLPVVPPTDLRIARMLTGTSRKATDIVGLIPPNLIECSVEKVAINAVLAGCRPEYFPVVLAAVEAALKPEFSMHGLVATLWFSGPVVIVNGPAAKRLGMNSGGNALGQGNRANATIGRALQLLIRNVGGGLPGEIDRSVLGNPGKYTFCFAEDESDPNWMPLNIARGAAAGSSTVTLFHGDGVQGVGAPKARTPQELCNALAASLWAVGHPRDAGRAGAILVLCPDHYDIFANAGWQRADVEAGLKASLKRPARELIEGTDGIAEGLPADRADEIVDKFNDGFLLVVRAGGRGGGFSAIIGGWIAQRRHKEVQVVSHDITDIR